MFLKNLTIQSNKEIIREINFKKGINLVVDESSKKITGNNIGKTTFLKLIDFCLGGDPEEIYIDPETKRNEVKIVKDFLISNEVLISLILTEELENDKAHTISIERNFLSRKNIVRKINGHDLTKIEFEKEMLSLLFPDQIHEKPSFRQIISHNIRYKDLNINNTLKTLDPFTTEAEYETLYLYMFGCEFQSGDLKQELLLKLKQEEIYKGRLTKEQTKTAYEAMLVIINDEIEKLNKQKQNFNLNENFEKELNELNRVKYNINKISSEISKLTIRKNIILESEEQLKATKSQIDLKQLKMIYDQATNEINSIQIKFEKLVDFHNKMIEEKIKFIKKEIPSIEKNISEKTERLEQFLKNEKILSTSIVKTDSYANFEELITKLNEKFRKKGEYETIIKQLEEVENNINQYNKQLKEIDNELFSNDFEQKLKNQLNKFNKFFSSISNILYGEGYILKHDPVINKKGQRLYKFSTFNSNIGSGKKQGEISCFDIAYTLFADSENIPCLHFILNDKKELMFDRQLVKIADLVNQYGYQFIVSILKDKLPEELNKEKYFILKLSDSDKLFRIENINK